MSNATHSEHDQSAHMARSNLLKIAKHAVKLLDMIKEHDLLDADQLAKLTVAGEHVTSVYHDLDYAIAADQAIDRGPRQYDENTERQLNSILHEAWKQYKAQGQ